MPAVKQHQDAERALELEEILDRMILNIMINLSQRGYGTEEIMDAMDSVCIHRRKASAEGADHASDH